MCKATRETASNKPREDKKKLSTDTVSCSGEISSKRSITKLPMAMLRFAPLSGNRHFRPFNWRSGGSSDSNGSGDSSGSGPAIVVEERLVEDPATKTERADESVGVPTMVEVVDDMAAVVDDMPVENATMK
ncbi:chromosome segregation ATPase [Corchorus capsularis]|uniref:Chromosome segregation ATPase n=1 Tax=Corchorus capsularis TaxID=210143 RepID=A0A1R3HH49_COCAP|nr:chromosome segregation ATPase [Corchorus capsularis]